MPPPRIKLFADKSATLSPRGSIGCALILPCFSAAEPPASITNPAPSSAIPNKAERFRKQTLSVGDTNILFGKVSADNCRVTVQLEYGEVYTWLVSSRIRTEKYLLTRSRFHV